MSLCVTYLLVLDLYWFSLGKLRKGKLDQGIQTKESPLPVGFFWLTKLGSFGPLTSHRNEEGRVQVYFMSASLEKLVFLVNSSNLGCCHRGVWEWRYSVMRPYSGSVTLNNSKDKTMLAPSGQYLKKYLGESTLYFSCFHVDFITALWLRPICSFFIWTNRTALDLWGSSSHTYHRFKRVNVFPPWFSFVRLISALVFFCECLFLQHASPSQRVSPH